MMQKKELEILVDEAIHFLTPVFKLESEPRKLRVVIAEARMNYGKGRGRPAAEIKHKKGKVIFFKPVASNTTLMETVGEEAGHWIHYQINPAIFNHYKCSPGNHVSRLITAYSYIGKKAPYSRLALRYTNIVNFREFVGAVAGMMFAREKCRSYKINATKELNRLAEDASWCVNNAIPFYQTGICEESKLKETGAAVNYMTRVLGEMAAYWGISENDFNSDLSKYARMPLAKARTFFDTLIRHMRQKGE